MLAACSLCVWVGGYSELLSVRVFVLFWFGLLCFRAVSPPGESLWTVLLPIYPRDNFSSLACTVFMPF